MAESKSSDGSSTSDNCGGSESALQLNIKTLDSQIYRFRVDTNMFVSALKEKIAAQSGVPVGQQRLIFRGKLLKDDHLISEYNLENEDTLHLVERQPQPSPGLSTGDTTSSNGNRGTTAQDPAGELLQRIGQIAQSIVMGALNVGDPNEAAVPDLSRVIGAVLNTFGVSNLTGGLQPGPPASHGNAAEELQGDDSSENQGGNQSIQWQAFHGPSSSHAMQPPLGAAVSFPSSNAAVPDSLSTLVEFLNQMELVFSRNGNQHSSSSIPCNATVLPPNPHGLPTVEGLSIVLQQAQRLLGEHAVPAISRTAVRLNREGGSNDPAVRGQVQTESIQLGMALQHLGAVFLELGRTLLTLHMGQSPADSFVNAGPAVYVSPSGPNPIMVQPFPLQTASLFAGSSGGSTSSVAMTPLSRNVNIHIHAPATSAVGNRDSSGEGMQGQPVTAPADFSRARDAAGVNSTEAAARSQPIMSSAEIDSRNRSLTNHQGGNHAQSSGWSDGSTSLGGLGSCGAGDRHVEPAIASDDSPGASSNIPIGLGVGSSLQPKRRGKQTRAKPEGASSSADSRVGLRQQTVRHGEDDMAEAMSELLQGSALDGLLAGVSQQTGVGSPDMLRNMLQQFAENPAMRSAVDQIAQQVDDRDIGSMLSGLDDNGGGVDFSRMMQQMMPIVSRALGGGGATSVSASSSRRGMTGDPQDVFQSLVDGAVNLMGDGGAVEDLVNELPGEGGLAQEFMEMLQRDVSRRFRDEAGS